MATGNEMYAKSAKILTEAKRLIRTGGSQKEINKAFKAYQIAYGLSCHLYQEEDKKNTEVVKLGDGLEMKVRHIGKDTAVLDLFRDGKRVTK